MIRKLCWIATVGFTGILIGAEEPKPVLKLADSTVRVTPTAEGAGTGDLFVQADNFPKQELKGRPTVRDVGVPATPSVQIPPATFVRELARSETGAIWLFQLTVAGFPRQSSMTRKMQLILGKQQVVVDYALTDKAASTFAWSFMAPPVWNLVDSSVAEIPIVVKEVQATGIRLLQSTLTRQGERALSLGTQHLDLCLNREGDCQPPDAIGPSDSRTLYLRLKNAGNGTYTGNVVIRCDQKPEGDTVAVTANVTTTDAQAKGVAMVAIGILLYFLAVVVARWRFAVNSRKELALLLLRQVEEMKRQVEAVVAAAPAWARASNDEAFRNVEALLSDENLRQFMPGLLNPDEKMEQFKSRLQSIGLRLESLNVVVKLGMSKIAQAWTVAGADPDRQTAVRTAVQELLAVPDGQISAADTKTKVTAILTTMNTALGAAPPAALDEAAVRMQLQHVWLSTEAWTWLVIGIWVTVTLLTGAMAMVLSKAGFGTSWDYALCLLWGLGLPAAGTQLNQLSTSGIGTKLGITVPKAG